jgi:pimeloyl-ACP methyl ester carboxylesterase
LKIDIDKTNVSLQGEEAMQKFCLAKREDILKADIAGIVEGLSTTLPDVDKEAMLQSTEMGQHIVDSLHEGLRISADGWVDDDLCFVKPWGFDFNEIKVPVLLYQGSEDKMVPFAHGQWLAEHLPQAKLEKHLLQGQGHISIFFEECDGIIDRLLQLAKAA